MTLLVLSVDPFNAPGAPAADPPGRMFTLICSMAIEKDFLRLVRDRTCAGFTKLYA